jgi:hypothetical protein
MSAEQVFSLCSTIAMAGWAGLVLAPRWTVTRDWVAPVVAPVLIAGFYIWLMTSTAPPAGGGFGSLKEVTVLFSDPNLLLAGWIHYLAFDLFVGAWEVRDAQRQGIHHLLVIPCLFATLMAGPAGLALYWLVRVVVILIKRRQHQIEEAAA